MSTTTGWEQVSNKIHRRWIGPLMLEVNELDSNNQVTAYWSAIAGGMEIQNGSRSVLDDAKKAADEYAAQFIANAHSALPAPADNAALQAQLATARNEHADAVGNHAMCSRWLAEIWQAVGGEGEWHAGAVEKVREQARRIAELERALRGLVTASEAAERDLLECAQVANSHVQYEAGNPEFPAPRFVHGPGLHTTMRIRNKLGLSISAARAALAQPAADAGKEGEE